MGYPQISISGLIDTISNIFKGKSDHDEIVQRINSLGFDSDTLANSILAILVGSTVELSQCKKPIQYMNKA